MHVQSNGGWLGGWLGGRLALAGRPAETPPLLPPPWLAQLPSASPITNGPSAEGYGDLKV